MKIFILILFVICLTYYLIFKKRSSTNNEEEEVRNNPAGWDEQRFCPRYAPFPTWEKFIKNTNWKVLYDCFGEFKTRFGNSKDRDVCNMLYERLYQIEYPIISDNIVEANKDKIIWVSENSSDDQIKEEVARVWAQKKCTCFVLEKTKKLKGFALSETLIICGISATWVFPQVAFEKCTEWSKKLLTKEDSVLLEKEIKTLNSMMEEIDVPSINCQHWIIDNCDDKIASVCLGYDLNHPKRLTYYEEDDFTKIIVKL